MAETLHKPQLPGYGLAMLGPLSLEVEGPISGGHRELRAVGKIVADPPLPIGCVDVVSGRKGGRMKDEG